MTDPELLRNLADRIEQDEPISYAVIAMTPNGGLAAFNGDCFQIVGLLEYQKDQVLDQLRNQEAVPSIVEASHGFKN